jgi:hypothetical protein
LARLEARKHAEDDDVATAAIVLRERDAAEERERD